MKLRLLIAAATAFGAGCLAGCHLPAGVQPPPVASVAAPVAVAAMKTGEHSPDAGGDGEFQDLVAVTNRMVQSILSLPEIAHARGTPRIVLDPVINETNFTINQADFLTRLLTQLNSRALGQVSFLDREMAPAPGPARPPRPSGQATDGSGPDEVESRGADYFLTGKLQESGPRAAPGYSDEVLYSFRLTDARTSEIIWEDSVVIKKQGLSNPDYR
ncbi:MAG: penicillin-binding protein activator LpoB [Opitutales bacterium]